MAYGFAITSNAYGSVKLPGWLFRKQAKGQWLCLMLNQEKPAGNYSFIRIRDLQGLYDTMPGLKTPEHKGI